MRNENLFDILNSYVIKHFKQNAVLPNTYKPTQTTATTNYNNLPQIHRYNALTWPL